jgi:hypothetical protein
MDADLQFTLILQKLRTVDVLIHNYVYRYRFGKGEVLSWKVAGDRAHYG